MKAKILVTGTLIFTLGLLFPFISSAQESEREYTRMRVETFLIRGIFMQTLIRDVNKDKAYLFGIGISVNDNGMADSVWYTNKTNETVAVMKFETTTAYIKKDTLAFKDKKNAVLIGIVYIRRGWDNKISNLLSLDSAFTTVMPEIPKQYLGKKVILFPAFNLVQAEGSDGRRYK